MNYLFLFLYHLYKWLLLLSKLECFKGISTKHVFEIANQLLASHLLYLGSWMNGDAFSFYSTNKVGFLLSVRCLYHKLNNTWLLGDGVYLFVFNSKSHSFAALTHEILSWVLKEKFHIPVLFSRCCTKYYCKPKTWCHKKVKSKVGVQ